MQKRVVFGLVLLVLFLQNVAAVSSGERYIVEIDDKSELPNNLQDNIVDEVQESHSSSTHAPPESQKHLHKEINSQTAQTFT